MPESTATSPGYWDADLRDDLFDAGFDWEDGNPLEGLSIYVVVTSPRGTRYAHLHSFNGVAPDEVAIAWEKAKKLLVRVSAACERGGFSPVGSPHWSQMQSVYGSDAYVDGNESFLEAQAERAAEGVSIF